MLRELANLVLVMVGGWVEGGEGVGLLVTCR